MTGTLFDIKRFAIHDGPGIRTTVFLKGCPLNCWWCHNPESQAAGLDLLYRSSQCLRCGTCVAACPAKALSLDASGVARDRAACTLCGRCAEACPAEAQTMVGRRISAEALAAEIARDRVFFDESGGGVTFSGGEPLAQPAFLLEMLDRCGAQGIHRAVDTSGYAPRATLLDVAARTDLFLFDLKLMDDALHRQYTGVGNAVVLENLEALSEAGAPVEIRIPVVPSITDGGNIAATGVFLASLPRRPRVRILPYHRAAMHKYGRFGMQRRLRDVPEPSPENLMELAGKLKDCGLEVTHE